MSALAGMVGVDSGALLGADRALARDGVDGDGCGIAGLLEAAAVAGTVLSEGDAGGFFAVAAGCFFAGDGVAKGFAQLGFTDLRPVRQSETAVCHSSNSEGQTVHSQPTARRKRAVGTELSSAPTGQDVEVSGGE